MESKALKEYRNPNYPRKEEVQSQPSLLRKSVYKRWQKLYDIGISGMLVAGLSLTGCDNKTATDTTLTQSTEFADNQNSKAKQTNTVSPAKVAALVAPIFEHGDGRGSFGCMAITPPAFISEDEALVIIKEELAKHGLKLDQEKVVLDNVLIAHGKTQPLIPELIPNEKNVQEEDVTEPLEIDLKNSDKGIYIEYVSMEDYFKLGGEKSPLSIQSYDFKQVAIETRKKINSGTKQGVYGIFYDPVFRADYSNVRNNDGGLTFDKIQSTHNKAMESSKELLRNQVNDFAKWLKEQGVL